VVPPMPLGPSQGGSALNLFDLDQMRRQQVLGVPPATSPAPAGATPTQPAEPVQTAPVQQPDSTTRVQP
ncbi:MAG: hypothetical protein JO239_05495, partial [Paraburkholderia sp.]|nr:hypothetical protein [Paraburkholderia sp.]